MENLILLLVLIVVNSHCCYFQVCDKLYQLWVGIYLANTGGSVAIVM